MRDPLLLAFDTSGPVGSVVAATGREVRARVVLARQAAHASGLLPAIDEVLEEAGVGRRDLDGLVVGEGPGSFTGVRVAAATAKGLGRALALPVRAVSSLAAAALATEAGPVRYALFDARAERVYGGCWGVGGERVETLVEPHARELRDLLAGDVPGGAAFTGDGALRHRALIEGAGFDVVEPGPDRTLADGLVEYCARARVDPIHELGAWEPAYVRAAGAERLWSA